MTLSKTASAKTAPVKQRSEHIDELIATLEGGAYSEYSPGKYGLPVTFRNREELQDWIQNNLKIIKDGRVIDIVLIDKQMDAIWDFWIHSTFCGIIWKSRGGGGSLVAAIIIFIKMVWKQESCIDLAGSMEQSQNVYEYVVGFFSEECIGVKGVLIVKGEPLKSNTELVTGPKLKCVPTSEKAARGKHPPNIFIDEACQKDTTVDPVIETAINMVFSEPEYTILALSTFHVTGGWFEDTWDHAKARGYKKYKWNVYDIMKKCEAKIDCRDCPLTERVPVRDTKGRITKYKYDGCNGKARNSKGWLNRSNVLDAKKKNTAENFRVEWECKRPTRKGRVYPKDDLDRALTYIINQVRIIKGARTAVGIDWGFASQTAVIPVQRHLEHVAVPTEALFTTTSTVDIISYLRKLKKILGEFIVYADASHPFNNADVYNAGFQVVAVPFGQWKKIGIDNCVKYMETGKVKISKRKCPILASQLDKLHKDERGMPVKKDDHSCDAFLCAMLHFLYLSEFPVDPDDLEDESESEEEKEQESEERGRGSRNEGGVLII